MKLKHFLMSTAAATMIAGGALAQDATAPETGVDDATTEAPMLAPTFTSIEEMSVADMIGMFVYDPEGNQISEIDYVISGVGGPEVVLGIGGFLGLGEYTVALPLEEFELGEDGNSLRLNTDKETLKTYPEFDESMAESLPGETSIASLLAQTGAADSMTSEESAVEEAPAEEVAPEADTGETDETMSEEGSGDGEMAEEPETEETTTQ